MKKNVSSVDFLYDTTVGRWILSRILTYHLDKIAVWFLRTPLSRPMISSYIRKYDIPVEGQKFASFRDFFCRYRELGPIDETPEHMISPCDGWLSVFPIDKDSCFHIKGSHYRVEDLVQDAELAKHYEGGLCMILRLCPNDYHHYCYFDDGYQGENHFIPGVLHSVQPIACQTYPVYTLNRRSWCLVNTDHFGPVIWTEIGALVVGGICNDHENVRVKRGMEKGHFDLAGSTITLLFEKDRVQLLPELTEALRHADEVQVRQAMHIGSGRSGCPDGQCRYGAGQ